MFDPKIQATNDAHDLEAARDIIVNVRRIVCDLVIATEHGGCFYSDPELRLRNYVEALEGVQVVEDALRREQHARAAQVDATGKAGVQ